MSTKSDNLKAILEQVAAHQGLPLERAMSLPPAAYTSPAFFDHERRTIFDSEWLCVGHVDQIRAPGDYVAVNLLGALLVMVRGEDGVVRVLSRVCRHRWTEVVTGAGNTERFICPFHAWAYRLDGSLAAAPLTDRRADFDMEAHCLPALNTEVWQGFVFVNFDDDAEPLAPQLTGLEPTVAPNDLANMRIAGVFEYDCAFNWKIIAETFMESYHHIGAHASTLQRHFPAAGTWAEDPDPRFTVLHNPTADNVPVSAGFGLTLPPIPGLDDTRRREFITLHVFPFHLFTLLPDQAIWFCIDPQAPDRTKLRTHLLVPPSTYDDASLKPAVDAAVAALDTINQEDITVDTLQQQGAASRLAELGPLVHLEKANWGFADYLRGRVTG